MDFGIKNITIISELLAIDKIVLMKYRNNMA